MQSRSLISRLAVALVCVVCTLPSIGHSQITDTLRCGSTLFDTLNVGPMVLGELRDTATWFFDASPADSLALSTNNPNRLRPHELGLALQSGLPTRAGFSLFADTIGVIRANLLLQPFDTCTAQIVKPVTAFVRAPASDGTILSLIHGPQEFIAIHSDRDSVGVLFRLLNNSTAPVTINSVRLLSGIAFRVKVVQTLPATIAQGDRLDVVVSLITTHSGEFRDSLIIDPNEPTGTEGFAIIAYRSDSAIVPRRISGSTWRVTPNPTDGILHLSEVFTNDHPISPIRVEIRDVLGNIVTSATKRTDQAGTFTLDLRPLQLAAGAYFVRVEYMTDEGLTAETVRIILR